MISSLWLVIHSYHFLYLPWSNPTMHFCRLNCPFLPLKPNLSLVKSPLNQYEIPYTSPLSLRSISQVTFCYLPHLGPLATFNAGCGRSRLSGALQLQCPVRPTGHVAAKRRRGSSAGARWARWESLGGCKKWEDMMVKWI